MQVFIIAQSLCVFSRVFDKLPTLPKPLPTPQSLPVADRAPAVPGVVADVADLRMVRLPKRPNGEVIDWSVPLRDAWDISESGALNIMEQFMSEGIEHACCKPHLTQGGDRCRV